MYDQEKIRKKNWCRNCETFYVETLFMKQSVERRTISKKKFLYILRDASG